MMIGDDARAAAASVAATSTCDSLSPFAPLGAPLARTVSLSFAVLDLGLVARIVRGEQQVQVDRARSVGLDPIVLGHHRIADHAHHARLDRVQRRQCDGVRVGRLGAAPVHEVVESIHLDVDSALPRVHPMPSRTRIVVALHTLVRRVDERTHLVRVGDAGRSIRRDLIERARRCRAGRPRRRCVLAPPTGDVPGRGCTRCTARSASRCPPSR